MSELPVWASYSQREMCFWVTKKTRNASLAWVAHPLLRYFYVICGWYAAVPLLPKLKSFASDGKPICLTACYYQKQTADSLKVRQENTQTVTRQFAWRKRDEVIIEGISLISLSSPPVQWDIQWVNCTSMQCRCHLDFPILGNRIYFSNIKLRKFLGGLEVSHPTRELALGLVWLRLREEKVHLR